MTRIEAIAAINAKLSSLDDECVLTVVEIVNEIAATEVLPRSLSPRELALIEQSKEDFKTGRFLTPDDYRAEMGAFLLERRAKVPKSA